MGKQKRAAKNVDDLERLIRATYTEKEFRRLVQRLSWAVAEMNQLAERVPAVAARYRASERGTDRGDAIALEKISPASRAAMTWLLEVLSRDPEQKIGERDRVQLQIIRGGRADERTTLFELS